MKQSEKNRIYELISKCTTGDIVLGREECAVINLSCLIKDILDLPVEQEEIKEVYAIKDALKNITI